jgi:hypothetical protein
MDRGETTAGASRPWTTVRNGETNQSRSWLVPFFFLPFAGVLFNSAHVTTEVRQNLVNSQHGTISFWAGLLIIVSALFTILSLISTFTAWAMVSSIDDNNAHCVLRSSIGQYAAELPGRLIVCSIYSFLISFMLFFFLLLPIGFWSILLLVCTTGLFFHVVSVFSGFGRIIMHSGAMSKQRIFSPEYEEFLVPESLHANLLKKAKCNLAHNTSIIRQYRRKQQPINRSLEEDQLWDHLNGKPEQSHFVYGGLEMSEGATGNRSRADSTVRFADEEQGLKGGSIDGPAFSNARKSRTGSFGGGNLKQSSYVGQHQRSMTPLSAHSEGSQRSNFSDISLDQDTPRSDFSQKHRAFRPPPIPSRDGSSVQNVSTASLELWLQGSSPEKSSLHKNETNTSMSSIDDVAANGQVVHPSSPQRPGKIQSPRNPPQEVVTKHVSSTSSDIAAQQYESDSVFSTSSGARSDRGLSEEERFAMDYGDFDSDEDDRNRMNSGEYNYLNQSQRVHDQSDDINTDNERSSLLGSGHNNFYSGGPPFSKAGPPLSRSKLKRNGSEQDPL